MKKRRGSKNCHSQRLKEFKFIHTNYLCSRIKRQRLHAKHFICYEINYVKKIESDWCSATADTSEDCSVKKGVLYERLGCKWRMRSQDTTRSYTRLMSFHDTTRRFSLSADAHWSLILPIATLAKVRELQEYSERTRRFLGT